MKTPAKPSPGAVRRTPVQARSRKRHDAILDAAAAIFADVGYEAATMQSIAARAGTSIGSVYQFFPDKLSVFDAVAERCLERTEHTFDRLFANVRDDRPAEALIDGAIDALAALHESDSAFRATQVNFALYPVYEKRDSALNRQITRRIGAILARRAPHLPERRVQLIATMIVQLVSAMMFVSERASSSLRAAMREELKTLVRRYVEPELAASRRPLRRP